MPSQKITELSQVASVARTDLILLSTNVASSPTSRAIEAQSLNPYYAEIVTVALEGGDFSTIQGAIDSITDASAAKPYVVRIYPGIYVENVVLKNAVNLQGVGPLGAVVIRNTTGDLLTMGTIGFPVSRVENIRFELNPTGTNTPRVLVATKGVNIFTNCGFIITPTNGYITSIALSGGTSVLRLCDIHYTHAGTGGGPHEIFNISGASTNFHVNNSRCDMDISSTHADDYILFVNDSNTNTEGQVISDIIFEADTSAGFDGHLEFYKLTAATTNNVVKNCYIHLHIDSGGANSLIAAYDVNAGGGAAKITSLNNHVESIGATDIYFAELDGANDALTSSFDDTNTAEIAGSGTYIYSNTVNGNFQALGIQLAMTSKTADYTLTDVDFFIAVDSSSGNIDITLPSAVGRKGRQYEVKKTVEANKVDIETAGVETIDGSANYTLNAQWNAVTVISDGANWFIMSDYLPTS